MAETRWLAVSGLLAGLIVGAAGGWSPTIEVAVGYSKSNTSPILKLFLSRSDKLVGPNHKH
jgi:hypothetical protein